MKHYTDKQKRPDLRDAFASYAAPDFTVSFDNYMELLDEMDMTEAQKEEFLQALWEIVTGFVELGFGTHPVQEAGGQEVDMRTFSTKAAFNTLKSEDENSNNTKGGPYPEG